MSRERSKGGWQVKELQPGDCVKCHGCGKVADDEEGAAWVYWEELPPGSDLAVLAGAVKPIECPECHGTGRWQHDMTEVLGGGEA